jgi:hypothetical protein
MKSWHVTSCALPRLGTDTPRVTRPAPAGVGRPGKWGGEGPVMNLSSLLRLFSDCMPPDLSVARNRFFLSPPAYGKLSNDFYVTYVTAL